MKVVALVSGGKDSCYAMMKCIQYGHEVLILFSYLSVPVLFSKFCLLLSVSLNLLYKKVRLFSSYTNLNLTWCFSICVSTDRGIG